MMSPASASSTPSLEPLYASIDIGTNSALLLIASVMEAKPGEVEAGRPRLRPRLQKIAYPRLGKGLTADGLIGEEAQRALEAALLDFRQTLRRVGARLLAVLGTEVFRKARNGEALLARIGEILGRACEVVSGERESRLGYLGVRSLYGEKGLMIVDIGGGSTELGSEGRHHSYPLGAVTLLERCRARRRAERGGGEPSPGGSSPGGSSPKGPGREEPSLEELSPGGSSPGEPSLGELAGAAAVFFAEAGLAFPGGAAPGPEGPEEPGEAERRGPQPGSADPSAMVLVGVGGTATTLAALEKGLERFSAEAVEGVEIGIETLARRLEHLAALSLAERKAVPGLEPARADIIVPGLCILKTVMEALGVDRVRISDRGLRYGALLERLSHAT